MRCCVSTLLIALFLITTIRTAHANDIDDIDSSSSRPVLSRQECLDLVGTIVGDIGDGAIHRDDYVCESNGQPPIATIVPAQGEPIATEGEVCCGRPTLSRQECLDQDGTIVGDIGDGTMYRADYICESNGELPIAAIVPAEGEPISDEGEVCCGPSESDGSRLILSRQECLDLVGTIVGDIGDGAIHRDDYVCESNGQPPIATIVPAQGEPIATEGEVCCAQVLAGGDDTAVQDTSATAVAGTVFLSSLMVIPLWNY